MSYCYSNYIIKREIKYKERKETKLQRKSNTKQQINIESMWKN